MTMETGPLVLYVDDERANRIVFAKSFENQFRVRVAANGHEALEVLGEMREPEAGGVVVDAGGDQLGHATPASDSPLRADGTSPARTS